MSTQSRGTQLLYVGTFTRAQPHGRGRSEGVYVYRLDPNNGAMEHVQTVADVSNPSFVVLSPDGRNLYAVNAVPEIDGQPGGAISAFAVDPRDGTLAFLNRQSTRGAGPAHVNVDQTGRVVMAANFGGGSIASFPRQPDGRIGPAASAIQHHGSGPHQERQQGPHAHSINLDPSNRFALVCDLGLDQVLIYRLDPERATLAPNEAQPHASTPPGSGPRHLDCHPNGRWLYVINEIDSTLTAFAWDGARGTMRSISTVPTLPAGFSGKNSTADVHVSPSGRFVYGSNRGHDSIASFAIDQTTGAPTPIGHESTRGQTPRNFMIHPNGRLMLVANQDTDNVVAFTIDESSGQLSLIGEVARIPSAVCLRLAE